MQNKVDTQCQNVYSIFCESIIPKLWESLLLRKEVEPILQNEIILYHKITKFPDNQSSLSRFYSLYESLILYAAQIYYITNKFHESDSLFESHAIDLSKLNSVKSAIIFKGTHKLAHFNVLESCLNSLTSAKKEELLVIFIDYPAEQREYFSKIYHIQNCLCLGSINKSLKIRYHYCAFILNKLHNLQSSTFWGIPFGMLFISKLIKNYYSNSALSIRYLTVKHKFSFNSAYVDCLVNGAPKLIGYDYANQSQSDLDPNFYTSKSLKINNQNYQDLDQRSQSSFDLLADLKIKYKKFIIVGIFARKEKLNPSFLDDLKDTLSTLPTDIKERIVLAVCSNTNNPLQIDHSFEVNVVNLHWGDNYFNYFTHIDLFLDTYPFGGGLLLAQALVRGISSLVSTQDISTSPSSIHAIVSRGLPLVRESSVKTADFISNYLLHSSTKMYWSAFVTLLSDNNIRHHASDASYVLGHASFLPHSQQHAEKLASQYLNLC